MKSAFQVIADWAWAKVRLKALQDQSKNGTAKPEDVTEAIHEFQKCQREKRKLESEEHEASRTDV